MSKEKVSKPGKKDLRKEVSHQLEISLGKLKEQLGEKKFNSRLKKAVKILTENMDAPKKEKHQKGKSVIKVSSDILIPKPPQKSVKVIAADTAPKAAAPKAPAKKTIKAKPESKVKK
jgi:hypothetical protein